MLSQKEKRKRKRKRKNCQSTESHKTLAVHRGSPDLEVHLLAGNIILNGPLHIPEASSPPLEEGDVCYSTRTSQMVGRIHHIIYASHDESAKHEMGGRDADQGGFPEEAKHPTCPQAFGQILEDSLAEESLGKSPEEATCGF